MTQHMQETRGTGRDELACEKPPHRRRLRLDPEVVWEYTKAATAVIAALGTLAAAIAQIIMALRR